MSQENEFYWVKADVDEPWEVALYSDGVWWFHGVEEGAENVEEIGSRIERS